MKKALNFAILATLALAFLFACSTQSTFADERDSKKYKTVKIGEQTWLAENLNYNAEGSKCYDNDPANCEKYGRLYDWQTAMKACPKGWHLPDTTEWNVLVDFAGGKEVAGKKLKATNGWNDNDGKSGNGEDKFRFAAFPGGSGYSGGNFYGVGDDGDWWSASEYDANSAYRRSMIYIIGIVGRSNGIKTNLFSVRCVRD